MRKETVLFLCTGNSARSQMAEALLRRCAGDHYEVLSAGTEPKGIHPMTRIVLGELGADISGQRSKNLTEYLGHVAVNTVITLCDDAERTCPVWPGKVRRMAWPFEDPAACRGPRSQRLDRFRGIRDSIDRRIHEWLQGENRDRTVPSQESERGGGRRSSVRS